MKRILFIILATIIVVPAAIVGMQIFHDPGSNIRSTPATDKETQIARGRYLALAGNCMGCHTARGGRQYAGGRAIQTPFGNIYAPNITPDDKTGIGTWTADDFWRAIHNGKSKDGSFLYPAFPYTNYTRVTRADSDAMYAYFRSIPAVEQADREHELRFPYNQRILLAGWRALYFRPGVFEPDTTKSAEWNRGAYLVHGLGHCSACHTTRNALGGEVGSNALGGGLIPMLNWYASPLTSGSDSGLGNWTEKNIADLLKHGVSDKGSVFGPMAEVVRGSLQHLTNQDVKAMSTYLKSLPQAKQPAAKVKHADQAAFEGVMQRGATLYEKHCVECHRADGKGMPPAYPPLAENRSLTMTSAVNPIRMVLNGGYPPSTKGNPRPYGMPPFGPFMSDEEVAAVVTYMRNAWGNQAPLVSPNEVSRYRAVPVE
ncbi:MAG: c-type cytochrome [Burkholderiaceae bacterium]